MDRRCAGRVGADLQANVTDCRSPGDEGGLREAYRLRAADLRGRNRLGRIRAGLNLNLRRAANPSRSADAEPVKAID